MGDTVRSVTYFTPKGYEQVYLREDLESDADLSRLVEYESRGFEAQDVYRTSDLGEHHYTVHSLQNGYATRVTTDEEGVAVTADTLTIHRAEDVAQALRRLLRPQR
jgi:hypothetical protein